MDNRSYDMDNNGASGSRVSENAGSDPGSLRSLVLRTALAALAVMVAAAALAVSFVGCVAPRAFMNLYRAMGAYGTAAVYAGEALDRASHDDGCGGGCEYIRLAAGAVEVASVAYAESGSSRHAEYLYDFTRAYLNASCHLSHSEEMDDYYERTSSSAAVLCTLYGYDCYVFGECVTAMRALGDESFTGGLGDGYDSCETFCEALEALASDLADDLIGENMYYALEGLTAYAADADDVSAIEDKSGELFVSYGAVALAAGGLDDGFPKAYTLYKLYRFVSAMESASGGAAFEAVWTKTLAESAYASFTEAVQAA